MEHKRVLIIGGSGFFGGHMASGFVSSGWNVYVGIRDTDKRSPHLEELASSFPKLIFTYIDLEDISSIHKAVSSCKPYVIINCAAYGVDYQQQDYARALLVNVVAVNELIIAASATAVEKVIHIGTAYEYGVYNENIKESFLLQPQGVYATTKAAGSLTAIDHAKTLHLKLAVIRPFVMFGEYEGKHKFVPLVTSACMKQSDMELTLGEQVRDFVYVADVVDACIHLINLPEFPAGEIFNIGTGQATSLRSLGELIAGHVGKGAQQLHWGAREYRSDEVKSCVADVGKARNLLGWSAKTSVHEAIKKTVEWQKKQGY